MTLRPADLLECVRQMSPDQRKELTQLIGDYLKNEIWENCGTPNPINDLKFAMRRILPVPDVTVDHFIQSKKECPNCNKIMMQCESHYRCWHCGNAEHKEKQEVPMQGTNQCPNCGHYSYRETENTINYVDWKCLWCLHEDRIMKQ